VLHDLMGRTRAARQAWQGGHKGFQRLGNASADPNPSGHRNRCGIGFLRGCPHGSTSPVRGLHHGCP
jgi:hypothetical protein